MKKIRAFQRLGLAAIAASFGFMAACTPIDVDTDDGLMRALESRKRLDRAIPRLMSISASPGRLEPFIPLLVKMYEEGSPFDREIITALASSGNPLADSAFKKAAESTDFKQVIQAAHGARATQSAEVQNLLLKNFDRQVNPEVRRVILDTGTTIKSSAIAAKAKSILNGNLDETPFSLLRTSCNVLEFQKDPDAAGTLLLAGFHMDGVGRSLGPDCRRALMALGRDVAVPVLLTAFKLENKDLNIYIEKHPDTMTADTVRSDTANMLAIFRAKEAIGPMLDFVGNTRRIPVPGTLAIRPAGDPAWAQWASLVGAASQAAFFAINDIGVRDNARAKTIFTDIFNWTEPFKIKFRNAIELTGTTNIEVSQRVNAFRVLRENELVSTEEVAAMVNVLKGEEFADERTFRNWARAAIATDMLTYLAITARNGDTKALWQLFNDMQEKEFAVPAPENEDAPLMAHANDTIVQRINAVRPAFELADRCDTRAACYAGALGNEGLSNYERIKIVYELGLSGDHQFFEVICGVYGSFDLFGQIYATNALANLGTAADIERIRTLSRTLAGTMSQIHYQTARINLENLIITLANK
ncbi:MAG: hypothetical protein FWC40_05245 [Proteobacteria bacterium]|nr:hypothetical protein [Pseudomonadota bacterium]